MTTEIMSADRLRALIAYDPLTGVMRWVTSPNRRIRVGSVAGFTFAGQRIIRLDGRRYQASRVAWCFVHGAWPTEEVGFANSDSEDLRLSNLRHASHQFHLQNRRAPSSRNAIGVLGVGRNSNGSKYRARLDGRHLGSYDTPEAAHVVYVAAKRSMHAGATL